MVGPIGLLLVENSLKDQNNKRGLINLFLVGMSYDALLVIVGGWFHQAESQPILDNSTDVYYIREGEVISSYKGKDSPYYWRGAGVAVTGSDVILAGGAARGYHDHRIRVAARYETDLDLWKTLPLMTGITWHLATIFIIDDKLYVVQGNLGDLQSLDLTRNDAKWTLENVTLPFPVNVIYSQAVVVNGTAYICGGFIGWPNNRYVISWAPGQMTWSLLKAYNTSRFDHFTVTDGSHKIWILGGCRKNDVCRQEGFIQEYSVAGDTWKSVSPAPEDKGENSVNFCVYWDKLIYVSFKKNHWTVGKEIIDRRLYIYDTITQEWKVSNTTLNTATQNSMAAIVPIPSNVT